MIRFVDYLTENRQVLRYGLYVTIVVILVWSLAVDTSHAHTWVEKRIPGFWSIFGFVSCVVLIFVARWFAECGISREENYYDN